MRPRKRFGQHFLSDHGVLRNMAAAIALRGSDAVFEIGPGQGALTDELMPLVAGNGRYVAVEIDRDLIPWLQARYANLELINADLLRVDLDELLLRHNGWRVVGNLPYNVSSAMIMRLCDFSVRHPRVIQDMHFMVQKEMALRLAACPGGKAWGRLSVMAQMTCEVELLFDVDPQSFTPPPKVSSSVIRMIPKTQAPPLQQLNQVDQVVRVAFAQRRKRLSNALKSLNIDWSRCSVPQDLRADDVTLAGFVELAESVRD